jgi:predicted DNA-binding transcriptional regulator AlpA
MHSEHGPDDLPELLTVSDIAKLLQSSKRTVHRYRSKGTICKPIFLGNRTPRWRKSDILDWISNGCPPDSDDQ